MFIGHTNDAGGAQPLKAHLENTAKAAAENAVPELESLCYQIGLLHDVGKYGDDFQKYIKGEINAHIDHSTRGARAANKVFAQSNQAWLTAAYCIAGHHGGIPDGGTKSDVSTDTTLIGRLKKEKDCSAFIAFKDEIEPQMPDVSAIESYLKRFDDNADKLDAYAFIVRCCESCLTDADYIDTESFMKSSEVKRGAKADFEACLKAVNARLAGFKPKTLLQKSRAQIQAQAYENAKKDADIYLMNMPTGSGKTLCSIKIALEKAIAENKKHIIYVIPYNSIIDQTANEFEALFGAHADIVRHQSTFIYDDENEAQLTHANIKRLACENWDAGIIITTAVQFFESVYSNRGRRLRKLHNMADSIIVFDEAHLMPVSYMAPCIKAVCNIVALLHSKAIFLTATMPDFKRLIEKYSGGLKLKIADLITDTSLFKNFKKCDFRNLGAVYEPELIERALQNKSSLIVVNRKADAVSIYNWLQGNKYHLSTSLTGYDRANIIAKIKADLKANRQVAVVSTSLIEAGVDLDFEAVFRETAGLDNILQTAGRCNREGKKEGCTAYIFTLEENAHKADLKQQTAAGVIKEFAEDISSPESIEAYYSRLYSHKEDEMESNLIGKSCHSPLNIPFRQYADNFQMIEGGTVGVVVPTNDESERLADALRRGDKSVARKLQLYSASVSKSVFKQLLSQGAINDYGTGIYLLENKDYYDSDIGIKTEGSDIII